MKPFNCVKKRLAQTRLKMLSTKYIYESYLIYLYKKDLALDNLQLLICYKTKTNQTKPICLEIVSQPARGQEVG